MMSQMKKNRLLFIVLLILTIVMITGCGGQSAELADKSSIRVFSDGHIEARIVEAFDQDYYNESELMEMVTEEVTTYNIKRGGEPIKVLSEELVNQQMILELSFEDIESFNDYMPDTIFCGTVNDAYQEGYDFNRSLTVVGKDGATIGKKDLLNMAKHKLIIYTGETALIAPNKITYYSQGMNLLDSKTVEPQSESSYFVIYK